LSYGRNFKSKPFLANQPAILFPPFRGGVPA